MASRRGTDLSLPSSAGSRRRKRRASVKVSPVGSVRVNQLIWNAIQKYGKCAGIFLWSRPQSLSRSSGETLLVQSTKVFLLRWPAYSATSCNESSCIAFFLRNFRSADGQARRCRSRGARGQNPFPANRAVQSAEGRSSTPRSRRSCCPRFGMPAPVPA